MVSTLAGFARQFGSADGIADAARFSSPAGVATDSAGNIYVADTDNDTIRKITPTAVVTTLAGSAGQSGNQDGTGSTARFNLTRGLATDGSGNVYVTDSGNTIRKITPDGIVTTLAGSAGLSGSSDGTGAAARFSFPVGVAIDRRSGNVYVVDTDNNKIRVGSPALADAAIIDGTTGPVRGTRKLDASPRTATSWQWSLIRRPSSSTAQLSSASIRNPSFTPDVADLYIFQLIASDGVKTSITTVSLTATNPVLRRRTAAVEP